MAGDWKRVRVAEIADVTDYVANGSFESLRTNVTYRRAADYAVLVRLVDYNAAWNGDFVYVDKSSYEFLRKSSLNAGDIVIANVGANAGTVFRAPRLGVPMTLGPNAILCRPKDRGVLRQDFLYYFLISDEGQELLRSILSGSAQPKFNKTDFRNLSIPIPPIPEQRYIAGVLGTLDDKIELNRRTNETLEAMTRAIFKSWFVDFDPVRARMEGRDPPGMSPETAALFPTNFHASVLGNIPSGWVAGLMSEHIEVRRGLSYRSADLGPGPRGMPLHNLNSVVEGGGYKYSGIKYYEGEYRDRDLVEPGDIVVANAEQGFEYLLIGHAAMIPGSFGARGLFSADLFGISPRQGSPTSKLYLYYLINSPSMHAVIAAYSNGTTVNHLSIDGLRRPQMVVPPLELVERFTHLVEPLANKQQIAVAESGVLEGLRDALLPALVSARHSPAHAR